jgi:hypothetical protein
MAWFTGMVSLPQNPPKASAPELEIVSAKWTMVVYQGTLLDPGAPSQTVSREGNTSMPVVVPNPKIAERTRDRTYYSYTAQVINRGEKEIKGLAWDYVFKDRATHEELKRQLGYSTVGLHRNQKTSLQIRTPSSPPKVISSGAIGAGGPAFEEQVVIQCILFADGSMWAHPEAKDDLCERVRPLFKYKSRAGVRPVFR